MKGNIAVLAAVSLTACATIDGTRVSLPVVTEIAMDEKLIDTAERLPGFGGIYLDDNGDLSVYLVEDVTKLRGEALAARQAQVQRALTAVFRQDLLAPRPGRGDPDTTQTPDLAAPKIILRRADFDVRQLSRWRAQANPVLEVPGVVFTDLDERRNRIRIGIVPGAPRAQAEAILKRQGIPADAILFEKTQPVRFHASLRDKARPVPGGMQIAVNTGVFSSAACTMGFNVTRSGVSGFVTNSHCTTTQGESEGTVFHQPNDPWLWAWLWGGNKVGNESADPEYFTGGACPAGRRCRFSDSAFVDYSVERGKDIARTTGWNNGSLTMSSNPRLTIVGELSSWVDGSELDKIGRTTGWTFGRVNGTCLNINVLDTDITLLCQHLVTRIAGNHLMSDKGDSGSPVFRWLGSTVMLAGILWGGAEDGSNFVFSPIAQIEQELGPLTTLSFPQPQPPSIPQPQPPSSGICPSGGKCCEWEQLAGKSKCLMCIASSQSCP